MRFRTLRSTLFIFSAIFINIAGFPSLNIAKACMPDAGPWFQVEPQFEVSSFPPGLSFQPSVLSESIFGTLHYTGSTPLYILMVSSSGVPTISPEDNIPPGYIPYYKLINNSAFGFQSKGHSKTAPHIWEPIPEAELIPELIEQDHGQIPNTFDPSRTEHRPINVTLPSPIPIHIPLLLNNALGYLDGTLIYKLNQYYDPLGAEQCYQHLEFVRLDNQKSKEGFIPYLAWRYPYTAILFLCTFLTTIVLGIRLFKSLDQNKNSKQTRVILCIIFSFSLIAFLLALFLLLIRFTAYWHH